VNMNVFSPQEILKIAINVEDNGKILYENLENKSKDSNLKSLWKYLKEQEMIHKKTFLDMLNNVGDYVVYEFTEGEYDAYIKALAKEYIFVENLIKEKIKEDLNSLEALDFGIYVEKESILTYSAFREYILKDKIYILDNIIREERSHLVKLIELKNSLKKEKNEY